MEMYGKCCYLDTCRRNHALDTNWFTICGLIQAAQTSVDIAMQTVIGHRFTDILSELRKYGALGRPIYVLINR